MTETTEGVDDPDSSEYETPHGGHRLTRPASFLGAERTMPVSHFR